MIPSLEPCEIALRGSLALVFAGHLPEMLHVFQRLCSRCEEGLGGPYCHPSVVPAPFSFTVFSQ